MFSNSKEHWSTSRTQYEHSIKNCQGHHDEPYSEFHSRTGIVFMQKNKRKEKGLSKAVLEHKHFWKAHFFKLDSKAEVKFLHKIRTISYWGNNKAEGLTWGQMRLLNVVDKAMPVWCVSRMSVYRWG